MLFFPTRFWKIKAQPVCFSKIFSGFFYIWAKLLFQNYASFMQGMSSIFYLDLVKYSYYIYILNILSIYNIIIISNL